MTTQSVDSPTTPLPDYTQPQVAQQTQQPLQPTAAAPQNGGAFAITSFVLGIASIVAGWTFIAPVIGLIFGILALRRHTQERVLALWGVWLNAAMLALSALIVLGIVSVVGLSVVGGAFYGAWY